MQYGREYMLAIDRQHAAHDYTADFWTLAAAMRIPVITGEFNSAVYLPNPLITLHPDNFYGEWTFTRFHELAHIVLRDSGIEAQLWHDADCPEQYRTWVEAYCNFGALQFQVPNPQLKQVLSQHRFTPDAILTLAARAGVDLFDAMDRVTLGFLEPEASRTSVLMQGSYVRRTTTTLGWAPLSEGDRLPEINLAFPDARIKALPARFGWRRVLATF